MCQIQPLLPLNVFFGLLQSFLGTHQITKGVCATYVSLINIFYKGGHIKGDTLCNNNSHNIHLVPKLVPFLVALGMSLSYALVNCTVQPLLLGVSRAFAVILHIVGKCPALVLQPVVSAVSCQTIDISRATGMAQW